GPAALPRHPRAVHYQRPRRARGVLRQLPDPARGGQGVRTRLRLPFLRSDDRARAARRGDPRGREPAWGRAAPSAGAEIASAAAVLLEEAVERRDRIRKLLVASSMSIYGEGQYRNPQTGESGLAPGVRPESQLAARKWDVLADDGTPLEPEPTAETKLLRPTSIYAI